MNQELAGGGAIAAGALIIWLISPNSATATTTSGRWQLLPSIGPADIGVHAATTF